MGILRDVIAALLPSAQERRLIRIDAGKSVADMASALGVSVQTIENWEGGGIPESDNAIRYGQLLRELDTENRNRPPDIKGIASLIPMTPNLAEELKKDDILPRPPSVWELIDGIQILDPDGWRRDGKSFDEAIDRAEWENRMTASTIRKIDPDA